MAAILNSAILDSAILHKKNFTHSFWLNLMMAAILNSANLNSTILDSAILVFPLKLTDTCQDWFPPFAPEKLLSFILILLDDGSHLLFSILNSAILDLAILLKTLTPTNSIWPKVIYSHSTWWWQPYWILRSWIQPFFTKKLHSFVQLNLMMAAILNSAMLDSDTAILVSNPLLSSLRFTQKHSFSTLTLTQTNSLWLT